MSYHLQPFVHEGAVTDAQGRNVIVRAITSYEKPWSLRMSMADSAVDYPFTCLRCREAEPAWKPGRMAYIDYSIGRLPDRSVGFCVDIRKLPYVASLKALAEDAQVLLDEIDALWPNAMQRYPSLGNRASAVRSALSRLAATDTEHAKPISGEAGKEQR